MKCEALIPSSEQHLKRSYPLKYIPFVQAFIVHYNKFEI